MWRGTSFADPIQQTPFSSSQRIEARGQIELCSVDPHAVQNDRDTAGKDVPAGTVAVVRSLDSWPALERATALSTLIRQRHSRPSCGGHAPIVVESLTPRPGIREQNRLKGRNPPLRKPGWGIIGGAPGKIVSSAAHRSASARRNHNPRTYWRRSRSNHTLSRLTATRT